MGKIIEGQVITSTALDSQGERLTEEAIQRFFEQLPEQSFAYDGHDLSKPPVARGFNKRLCRSASGELAIVLDIEIVNEEAYDRCGGFSIAYTRTTFRRGGGEPAIRILANPQQFDVEAIARQAANAATPDFCIDVTERVEKAAGIPTAIIIISILLPWDALSEMWRGFWNKAGGDLFDYLKKMHRRDAPQGARSVRLEIPFSCEGQSVRMMLSLGTGVTPAEVGLIDLGYLRGAAVSICRGRSAHRLIGRVEPGPRVVFEQIVDSAGRSWPL